ncbi:alpha-galactosidase [Enterococcus florum]|uniref:Alpha-galactosidase n=1 Tax=Enterococcus florum TaxID=2480627 RepID=A0A4P5PF57_9ENTE|nr:alpha-galactosidase [Enterococcus florum]GCF94858.1 alpha-galactosidase [Enterococcus florum]
MKKAYAAFDQTTKVFHLRNEEISYMIQLEEDGILSHLYFGKAVKHYSGNKQYPRRDRGFSGNVPGHEERAYSKDTVPQEYSSHGSMDYRIPASIFRRENGSNLHDLRYADYRIEAGKPVLAGLPQSYVQSEEEATTLVLILKDRDQEIFVELSYTIYHDRAVITRSVKVLNQTAECLSVEKLASLQLDLTNDLTFDQVISLPGAHIRERQINRETISAGIKRFESRRGTSSHHMNSFIALVNQDTNENEGPALGIHLVYSGNHAFELEKDQIDQVRIVAGINDYNFSWEVKAGESFQTPEVLLVYSDQGLNQMSDTFHHLLRERVARGEHQFKERPILVNNWEATYFDFTSKKIEQIVDEAAAVGIEMFVLDDGWFGHRSSDNSSLGDWFEFEGKLADGLKGIADYVHQKGLKFGLWFEPEMISIDSELYQNHPDYLMQEPGRCPSSSRDQHLLDMGRKEVRQAIEKQIIQVLDQVEIDYIKWDMNRSMSDAYSIALDAKNQGETTHRYMLGVYELLEHLTNRYPSILWEGCSGGGGRFDAGFLYYMPQSWTSDNTDAVERLKIQYGTSLGYPISAMTAHVSAVPNHQTGRVTSLKTRGEIAMSGVFGYELDLTLMEAAEKAIVKEQVAWYQEVRALIQFGNFLRLASPFEGNLTAWMFVDPKQEEALVFMARTLASAQPVFHEVILQGLQADYQYQDQATKTTYFGDELMTLGVYAPDFYGDFQTQMIHLKKV